MRSLLTPSKARGYRWFYAFVFALLLALIVFGPTFFGAPGWKIYLILAAVLGPLAAWCWYLAWHETDEQVIAHSIDVDL
jgi:hypothetical protein